MHRWYHLKHFQTEIKRSSKCEDGEFNKDQLFICKCRPTDFLLICTLLFSFSLWKNGMSLSDLHFVFLFWIWSTLNDYQWHNSNICRHFNEVNSIKMFRSMKLIKNLKTLIIINTIALCSRSVLFPWSELNSIS